MKEIVLLALCLSAAAQTVTFSKHVAPILFDRCAPCHRPGESGPFSLLTYADARSHATQIVSVTEKRYMPPWPPEPGHGDFEGSRRLTTEQIATLAAWVRTGLAEGDPADLPPAPRFAEGWQHGQPDLILRMRQPYLLPAGGGDVFRNFILPAELKQTRYIRAMELRPGNKRVVHHANLVVDRGQTLRKRDGLDGQPGFAGMEIETEGNGEFDPDSHFLFWKPGTVPREEPPDMAWRLDPGTDLVVNLHLQPSGKPEIVDAVAGLYFTDQAPKRVPMLLQLEHDGAIDIPAGGKFEVTDRLRLPVAVDLLAIYPHAHYLGKQVEAWAEPPGGPRRSLLLINDWDINWQATYTYRQPVALPAGTVVAMRISYDNTVANPRNPARPPKRVKSGNRSEDEMGHVWLQVLPRAQGDADPRVLLQQALMRRRIEKYPADYAAHFNLGAALQAMGKDAEALPVLRQAVRLQPSNATARNNLATSLLAGGELDQAIGELRESLRLDSGYGNARFNLARVLAAKGDADGALGELATHLRGRPDDARAHELAAGIYAALGKFGEAVPHFRRAAALEPSNTEAQINLGAALASAGQLREAVTAFESALKADPTNQAARENLARARAGLGLKP